MAEPKIIKDINQLESRSIVSQPTPPVGVVAGRLWLDESDNEYQGTVLVDVDLHLNDEVKHDNNLKIRKSGKDTEGIFAIYEQLRNNGTLAIRSVLSGGTTPLYTTRTITYYAANGTTVQKTVIRALTYDVAGDLVSEV